MKRRSILIIGALACISACATRMPDIPYPVFTQADDIPDSFIAALPGTRAKVLITDGQSRRSSLLLQLPADFSFGTGGVLDKTLELYVLEGDLMLGEFELGPGGYAYLPARAMGVSMKSRAGALLLYFLDDVHPRAIIQTPIISNSNLLQWEASDSVDDFGLATKELRFDPGSGARTWLYRIEPGAVGSWQKSSTVEEGFLVSGDYRHSECRDGIEVPGNYVKGGYYLRPAETINGGPQAVALTPSIWIMRVPEFSVYARNLVCAVELADSQ